MNMEGLKANKLTEEEMSDVAGGEQRWCYYKVMSNGTLKQVTKKLYKIPARMLIRWNVGRYPDIQKGIVECGWELRYLEWDGH